jgi:cysteinyl-tRNA synthetase
MSIDSLGAHFDIHTGGVDHREVHHPNEDAQSRAYLADGERWVSRWMHNEFLLFDDERISKTKGGGPTLDTVRAVGADPLSFRLFLLASHYRSQAKVADDELRAAGRRFDRLRDNVQRRLPDEGADLDRPLLTAGDALAQASPAARPIIERIDAAISDDLGTPAVLASLDTSLADESLDPSSLRLVVESVRSLLGLDLLQRATVTLADDDRAAVEALVAERDDARATKDFGRADELRDRLRSEFGVVVKDGAEGSTWTVE